jgi:flavin-dependent trigonelline monooxygenase, reductase component
MSAAVQSPPMDARALRAAFGSFMTGVTVVTTRNRAGQAYGFTANSFTSVSLDPPLLLVCPGKFLSSYAEFEACDVFAVSILAEGQEEISNTFASFKGDRFAKVETDDDLHGVPVIAGAVAVFSCQKQQVMEAGDHALLIGQVKHFHHSARRGLGYAGGKYFSLGLEQSAARAPKQGLKNVASAIIEQNGAVYLQRDAAGYFLPQVVVSRRGLLRDALQEHLATLELGARLAQVYSIFDQAATGEHHTCFRATTHGAVPREGAFVAVEDLARLDYAVPGQAATLARYATEYQTGLFGLFIGDADGGDIHYS